MKTLTPYKTDYYAWVQDTVRAIRECRWSDIDIEALSDEVEDLGKSERHAIESILEVILIHLLKIKYQPEKHTRSWDATVKVHRNNLRKRFRENPSLRAEVEELVADAYDNARTLASGETGLPEETFPEQCEWSLAEVLGSEGQ